MRRNNQTNTLAHSSNERLGALFVTCYVVVMLTPEWKRVVLALRLVGAGLLVGALAAALPFLLTGRDELRFLGFLGLGANLLSTIATVIFATVPPDTRARGPATVAVVFFTLELLCRLVPAGPSSPASLLLFVTLFALIGLLAHLRALSLVGLYLRVDKIYERASSLSALLFVVIAGSLVAVLVSCLMPAVGFVVMVALSVVAIAISIAYASLVFKTASTVRTLLP